MCVWRQTGHVRGHQRRRLRHPTVAGVLFRPLSFLHKRTYNLYRALFTKHKWQMDKKTVRKRKQPTPACRQPKYNYLQSCQIQHFWWHVMTIWIRQYLPYLDQQYISTVPLDQHSHIHAVQCALSCLLKGGGYTLLYEIVGLHISCRLASVLKRAASDTQESTLGLTSSD